MTVPVLYDPSHHSKVVLDVGIEHERVGVRQRWASEARSSAQANTEAEANAEAQARAEALEADKAAEAQAKAEAQAQYENALKTGAVDTTVPWECPVCGHENHAGGNRCTQCRREF